MRTISRRSLLTLAWQALAVRLVAGQTGLRGKPKPLPDGAVTHGSVNASCPVAFDNKVFVSASYRTGSALVEVRPDFTHRVVWTTQEFGLHFNTAIYRDGYRARFN